MFAKNALEEYWQGYCMICTDDVFSYNVFDVHYIFEDGKLRGKPICKGCFNELKDKIPNNINVIKKQEKERAIVRKKYWDNLKKIERKKSLDNWL